MITDIVQRVAGERAVVTGLISAGIDPHLYKPTRDDLALLRSANVVFYNGLLLEGKMTDALVRAGTGGRAVHAVTAEIDEQYLLEPPELEGLVDPHVWMDPDAWAQTVAVVRDALVAADPAGEPEYAANAAALSAEIGALQAYAGRVLSTVPEDRRVLVTAHDAFNYFGRRYGFEVLGIQGISTESESGVRDVEQMVQLLVDRKIPAVFIESTVPPDRVESLIEGAARQGHDVTLGGELFSDATGPGGTYEGTYVGMIDHNVTVITRALGGDAPVDGMAGKLGQGAR